MKPSLPVPVSMYFEISNGSNLVRIAHCFAVDAVVVDEGQTYLGHDAIRSWQRDVQQKFEFTVEPVSTAHDGDRLRVATRVVGNFPGSPAQLDHVFGLDGDQIKSLEIG